MRRIKTATGLYRDERPEAGAIDMVLMVLLAFLLGATGLCATVIYLCPTPVGFLALLGRGAYLGVVFQAIALTGGTYAALTVGRILDDELRARRARRRRYLVPCDPARASLLALCSVRENTAGTHRRKMSEVGEHLIHGWPPIQREEWSRAAACGPAEIHLVRSGAGRLGEEPLRSACKSADPESIAAILNAHAIASRYAPRQVVPRRHR